MHITQRKACFSEAYARAIAASVGLNVSKPDVDDESVDITFRAGPDLSCGRGLIDIQLKCGSLEVNPKKPDFGYSLKMKNYDDLRDTNLTCPKILVVLDVPSDTSEDWLVHSEDHLALRRCAYWLSIKGRAPVVSKAKDPRVAVRIPRAQLFTPSSVMDLFHKMNKGQFP